MFLTDNAKLDGTPKKAKLNEKYTLVFILFQVLKILLIKKIQLPVFLFLVVFYQLLHQQISFYNFIALHSTLSEKRFLSRIFLFFNRFTPVLLNILHGQDPLNMTKVFFFNYICYLDGTVVETASLIQCKSLHFPYSDSKVTRILSNESFLLMLTFLGGVVHSASWKYSMYFVYIFRTGWNFLIKFCSTDPIFNRSILRHLRMRTLQLLINTYCLQIS